MSLRCPINNSAGLVCLSFNQDCSCIALGTTDGIRIYNIDTHQTCYRMEIGAIGIAQMLFCTSLVAYVGAGEQPALTPRRLTVWNTSSQSPIQDLAFPTSVLAVHLNRQRLVAVLAQQVHVYALQDLSLQRTIDTPVNPHGLAALTSCCQPTLLAVPADSSAGVVRVWDLLAGTGGTVLAELPAHQAALQALAWSCDGALLASASVQGTVIRVHRLPSANKVFTFRRGTRPATLTSLAFSPAELDPPLLAAASSHGTVHIFRCAHPGQQHPAYAAASAAAGLLSSVISVSLSDVMEPQRNIARVALPCGATTPTLCALRCPPAPASAQGGGGVGRGGPAADSIQLEDAVVLAVISGEGLLYEYLLDGLTGPEGPRATLSNEVALLGSSRQLGMPSGGGAGSM